MSSSNPPAGAAGDTDIDSGSSIPPWPPAAGLSTHIVSRSQTTLSMSGASLIAAPASLVWAMVTDTSTYSTWNTFTPRVHITSQPPSPSSLSSSSSDGEDPPPPPFESPVTTADSSSPHTGLSPILERGTRFTFDVVMQPATHPHSVTPTALRVTDISTPAHPSPAYIPETVRAADGSFWPDLDSVYRICWTTEGRVVSLGLRGERFTEIVVLPSSGGAGSGERCMYRTWECQAGPLASVVKWKYGRTLAQRFADHAADVKREAERRWAAEKEREKGKGEDGVDV